MRTPPAVEETKAKTMEALMPIVLSMYPLTKLAVTSDVVETIVLTKMFPGMYLSRKVMT